QRVREGSRRGGQGAQSAEGFGPARSAEIQNRERPDREDRCRTMPVARGVLECSFGLAESYLVLSADRPPAREERAQKRQRILGANLVCELSGLGAHELRLVKALFDELVRGMRA